MYTDGISDESHSLTTQVSLGVFYCSEVAILGDFIKAKYTLSLIIVF